MSDGYSIPIGGGYLPESEEVLKEFLPKSSSAELDALGRIYNSQSYDLDKNISNVDTLVSKSRALRQKIESKARQGDTSAHEDLLAFDSAIAPAFAKTSARLHERLDQVSSYKKLVQDELDRGWFSKSAIEVGKFGARFAAPVVGDITGLLKRLSYTDPVISGVAAKKLEDTEATKDVGAFHSKAFKDTTGLTDDGATAEYQRFIQGGGLIGGLRATGRGVLTGRAFDKNAYQQPEEKNLGTSVGNLMGDVAGLGIGGIGNLKKLSTLAKVGAVGGGIYGATRDARDPIERLDNTINFLLLGEMGGSVASWGLKLAGKLSGKLNKSLPFSLGENTALAKPSVSVETVRDATTPVSGIEALTTKLNERINTNTRGRVNEITNRINQIPIPRENVSYKDIVAAVGPEFSYDTVWHAIYDPELGSPELAAKLDPELKNLPEWFTEADKRQAKFNSETFANKKLKDIVKERSIDAEMAQADQSFYEKTPLDSPTSKIRVQVPGTNEHQVASALLGETKAPDLPENKPLYSPGSSQLVQPNSAGAVPYAIKVTDVKPVNGTWVYEGLDQEGRTVSVPESSFSNSSTLNPISVGDKGTIKFQYGVGQDAVKNAEVLSSRKVNTKNGEITLVKVKYKKSPNSTVWKETEIPESQFTKSTEQRSPANTERRSRYDDLIKSGVSREQALQDSIAPVGDLTRKPEPEAPRTGAMNRTEPAPGTAQETPQEPAAASETIPPTQDTPQAPAPKGEALAASAVPAADANPIRTKALALLSEVVGGDADLMAEYNKLDDSHLFKEINTEASNGSIPLDVRDRFEREISQMMQDQNIKPVEGEHSGLGSLPKEQLQSAKESGAVGDEQSVGKKSKSEAQKELKNQKRDQVSSLGYSETTPVKASWLMSSAGQDHWTQIRKMGLTATDPAFIPKMETIDLKIRTAKQAAERMTQLLTQGLNDYDKSVGEFYKTSPKDAGRAIQEMNLVGFLRHLKEKGVTPTVDDIARFVNDGRSRPSSKITRAWDTVFGTPVSDKLSGADSVTLPSDLTGGLFVNLYNGTTRLYRNVFTQKAAQERMAANLPKLSEVIDNSLQRINDAVRGQVGRKLDDSTVKFLSLLKNNLNSNDPALQEAAASLAKEAFGTDKIENPWTWFAGNKMQKLRQYEGLHPLLDSLQDAVINRQAWVMPLRQKVQAVFSALPEEARTRVFFAANDGKLSDLKDLKEQAVGLLIRDTFDSIVSMHNEIAPSLGKDLITVKDNYVPHIFDSVSKESWRSADDKRAFEIFNQFEKFRSDKRGFSTDIVKNFDTYMKVVFDDMLFSVPLEIHKQIRPVVGEGTGAMLDRVVDLGTGRWKSQVDKFVMDKVIRGGAEAAMKKFKGVEDLPIGSGDRQKALEYARTFGIRSEEGAKNVANAITSWEYFSTVGMRLSTMLMHSTQSAFTLMDISPKNWSKALGETFAAGAGRLASKGKELEGLSAQHEALVLKILPNLYDPIEGIDKANLTGIHEIIQHVMDSPIGLGGLKAIYTMNRRLAAIGGYYEALDQGLSGPKAIDFARSVVERSGLMYTPMNRPGYLQSAGTPGRVALTFMDTPTRLLDRHLLAYGEFKRALQAGDKETAAQIGSRYLTGVGAMTGVYYLLSGMGLSYTPGQVGLSPVEVAAQAKDAINNQQLPSLNRFIRGPGWNLIDATGSSLSQDPSTRPYADALESFFLPWYVQTFKDYVDFPAINHQAEKVRDLGNGPVFLTGNSENTGVAATPGKRTLRALGFRDKGIDAARDQSESLRSQGESVKSIRSENLRRIREGLLIHHEVDQEAFKTLAVKGDYQNGDELNQAILESLHNGMKPEVLRQLEKLPKVTRQKALQETGSEK